MKIPLKAKVICKDGDYGNVKDLLIDPVKERVSHIVIENKHKGLEVIVPTEILDYSSDSVVTVEVTADVLDGYPTFLVQEFISISDKDSKLAYWGSDPTMTHGYTMFPYVLHDGVPVIEVTTEAIPKGELKYKKGMCVKNSSGKTIGHIDEFIVDDKSENITHIVMRTGHLFGSREVAVPNVNIESFSENCIVLNIDEEGVKELPEVVIKRAWS